MPSGQGCFPKASRNHLVRELPRWHDAASVNSFGHFILTRFNVPLQFDLPPGHQPAPMGLDAGWLTRRFELFERVCLASVARQTQPDFQWLVFLDEATPDAFRDRMAALATAHGFLKPVYCDQFADDTVLPEIRRHEPAGKIRITTRLDNDDAIHPRLIEQVQQLARRHQQTQDLAQGFFISFPIGCCEREGDFYLQRYRYNPFTSFVSSPTAERTVLGSDHRYIADAAPVVFHWCRPLWCQIIHGENVANRLRGIYWPGGGRSAFGPYAQARPSRSCAAQWTEWFRSLNQYVFHRGT